MKFLLTVLSCFMLALIGNAQQQTPNASWVSQIDNYPSNTELAICLDNAGNLYATGKYSGCHINGTLYPIFSQSFFLAKFNILGNLIWIKTAIMEDINWGFTYAEGVSVATDATGNVYVTGNFTGKAIFENNTLVNQGDFSDIFLAKYDSAGNVLWAKSAGGNTRDRIYNVGLQVDKNGHVYIEGEFGFNPSTSLDSSFIQFDSTILKSYTNGTGFIAQYDTNGNFNWAKAIRCFTNNYVFNGVLDSDGNLFTLSSMSGNTWFDNQLITVPDSSNKIVGIAKLSATTGQFEWIKTARQKTIGAYITMNIKTDNQNNVYVAGNAGSLDFDGDTTLPGGFIVKWNNNGNFLWAKSTKQRIDNLTCNNHQLYSVATLQGKYVSNGDTLKSLKRDVLVTAWDKNGNERNSFRFGSIDDDFPYFIHADEYDNLYVAGINNNNLIIGNQEFIAGNSKNEFISKFDHPLAVTETLLRDDYVAIYPNPAAGRISVRCKENFNRIMLTDPMGRTILDQQMNQSLPETNLQLPLLPEGVYFLHVINIANDRIVKKLIIQQ